MSRQELIAQHRQAILELAAKHGAMDVRVFGSVARGEDTPESDIDFVVKLAPERSLLDLGGLLMDLRRLLGEKVDLIEDHDELRPRFRDKMRSEAVSIGK